MSETRELDLNAWKLAIFPLINSPELSKMVTAEEKIKFAMIFLQDHEELLTIKHHQEKSSEKALEKINKANKHISTLHYKSLLKLYTEALAYAPENSEEMAKAYANRSAVLCNQRLYQQSLIDVGFALKIGYPDNLKAKLYVRQAKALRACSPNMVSEVNDSLANARLWMEKMDPINKQKIKTALAEFSENKTAEEPRKIWSADNYLGSISSSNSKISRASSAIALKYSEEFGRHIVATRDIEPGETLVVHRSYASLLFSDNYYTNCWHCSKYLWNPIPCRSCVNIVFCNDDCRKSAWNEYHDIECKMIGVMIASDMSTSEILSLRLLIKALKELGNIQGLKNKIKEIESVSDPINKTFTDSKYDETKYASVYSLTRLPIEHIFAMEYALKAVGILYFLSVLTDLIEKKFDNYKNSIENKNAMFICQLLYRHLQIVRNGASEVEIMNDDGILTKRGVIIQPFFQLCNHSCDRNIYHFVLNDMNSMISIQTIKKGEQIYCSYGPEYLFQTTEERRAKLKYLYHYFCKCYACKHNWNPSYQIPSCMSQVMPVDSKRKITNLKNKIQPLVVPIMSKNLTTEEKVSVDFNKIVTLLNYALNILGKYSKYPSQETMQFKYSLVDIYRILEGY
ncbi:SET and MYND domain-containing protein DDB_G0273589 [Microplitis demolitor]|uniref:SET and MYND domain-containing protein DDB_G0273589 n=1 Tax=Microplitis demolitor TaxID=69319 RepID=UPI0004CD53BF|nr:SET and MYND domain-containing protein DDB_G0273589 [Microplitis demolitor]